MRGADESLASELHVVADFVAPCAHCGIACVGTFRLWYVDGGRRVTFELDRPSLWELLEGAVRTAIDDGTYPALTPFIRDWNQGAGWTARGLDEAGRIEASDILAAVAALEKCQATHDARQERIVTALADFVRRCAREDRELWICET